MCQDYNGIVSPKKPYTIPFNRRRYFIADIKCEIKGSNMYLAKAKVLSGLLFFVYCYIKTKERATLLGLLIVVHVIVSISLFRVLYPDIALVSPTIEYMVLLVIVGIPFLVATLMIGREIEKMTTEKRSSLFKPVFDPTRSNIIFWSFIIIINLMAFMMDVDK